MRGRTGFGLASMLSAAMLLAGASELSAQQTTRYKGFWIGFGFGGGWSGTAAPGDDALGGGAFYLRMGGTVSPHFLFGGEIQSWFRSSDGGDFSRVNTNATALVYPSTDLGLFLKGGFGVASYQDRGRHRTGVGTTFGAGYDVRLGNNLYLTPNADLMLHFLDDFTESTFVVSLGLTWH